jgi:hypothetical protein
MPNALAFKDRNVRFFVEAEVAGDDDGYSPNVERISGEIDFKKKSVSVKYAAASISHLKDEISRMYGEPSFQSDANIAWRDDEMGHALMLSLDDKGHYLLISILFQDHGYGDIK